MAALINRQQAIDLSVTLLRIASGIMLLQAGGLKLFGWFGGMPDGTKLEVMSQIGIGAILEVVGGALIAIGLFTRPTAFILSGMMAVAYWQFHAPGGNWPIQNHGESAVLLCFIYLFFAAYGAGPISVDELIGRKGSGE